MFSGPAVPQRPLPGPFDQGGPEPSFSAAPNAFGVEKKKRSRVQAGALQEEEAAKARKGRLMDPQMTPARARKLEAVLSALREFEKELIQQREQEEMAQGQQGQEPQALLDPAQSQSLQNLQQLPQQMNDENQDQAPCQET